MNDGGFLAIAPGKIGAAKDANCRGCHTIPDGKKSGRTLLPVTDAHFSKGVACTRCHVTPSDGVKDPLGLAMANPHQIGKGDITIGSVRNDLDGTVKDCADCHLKGGDLAAPDPTPKHAAIPSSHLAFMKCQVCHIRHLDDDQASSTQEIPELVIEMASNGTQNASVWSAYLGTDPLDPTRGLPELAGKPFRWYPAIRWYKGKLATVKPLYTAWFGEWIDGAGDAARIRPIPLRLVRRAITGAYAPGSPRLASLPLTPGAKVATGAPILHRKSEIRAALVQLRDAVDTANPDPAANDIVVRPVLVRAGKVYFLNDAGEVEYFESAVGESHDFAVNHNVVGPRDPANPVLSPGPYGAGGCNDCHGPSSAFFYGKQLAEPAEYDYLDEQGTVPNPDAGKPRYAAHYELMGYARDRVEVLTAVKAPVLLMVDGAGSVAFGDGQAAATCLPTSGGCKLNVAPGATVRFTATSPQGMSATWTGCTPVDGDPSSCTALAPTPSTGASNQGLVVRAVIAPPPAPPPTTHRLDLTWAGTGDGAVTGVSWAGGGCGRAQSPAGCTADVPAGATVTLRALPGAAALFQGWGIACTGTGDCTFDMIADRSVSARFEPSTYPLSVSIPPPGLGAVASADAPRTIDCASGSSSGCTAAVPSRAVVRLTATPAAGQSFKGWSGGACRGTAATCDVSMDGAKSVVATFAPTTFALAVTVRGGGQVAGAVGCGGGTCSAAQPNGSAAVLTATAAADFVFKGWQGCSAAAGDRCTVYMTSDRAVVAVFEPASFLLTVTRSGTGAGSASGSYTSASGSGALACGAVPCAVAVPNGATVTLSAVADPGSTFRGWGVVCAGAGACTFKMNGPKSPVASFSSP